MRALTGSEIMDAAVRTYQTYGWTFLRLTAVPTLLCLASVSFLSQFMPMLFLTSHKDNIAAQIGEFAWACFVAVAVAVPLFLMGFAYATGIVVLMTSDRVLGNAANEESAIRRVNSRIWKLFGIVAIESVVASSGLLFSAALFVWSGLLSVRTAQTDDSAGIVAGVAILGAIVGGLIYIGVRISHGFVVPAALLEGTGPLAAGKRSRTLMRAGRAGSKPAGSIENVYAVVAMIWLIVLSGAYGIQSIFDVTSHLRDLTHGMGIQPVLVGAVELLPIYVTLWFTMPLWGAAVTIAYYDRRVRNEGYDIETLAADVRRSDRQTRFQL